MGAAPATTYAAPAATYAAPTYAPATTYAAPTVAPMTMPAGSVSMPATVGSVSATAAPIYAAPPAVTYAAPPMTYGAPVMPSAGVQPATHMPAGYGAPVAGYPAYPSYGMPAQAGLFDMLDKNHDGTLSREEFAKFAAGMR